MLHNYTPMNICLTGTHVCPSDLDYHLDRDCHGAGLTEAIRTPWAGAPDYDQRNNWSNGRIHSPMENPSESPSAGLDPDLTNLDWCDFLEDEDWCAWLEPDCVSMSRAEEMDRSERSHFAKRNNTLPISRPASNLLTDNWMWMQTTWMVQPHRVRLIRRIGMDVRSLHSVTTHFHPLGFRGY
jgi:hypothetical protein